MIKWKCEGQGRQPVRTGKCASGTPAAGSAGKEEPGPSKSWGTFQDGEGRTGDGQRGLLQEGGSESETEVRQAPDN